MSSFNTLIEHQCVKTPSLYWNKLHLINVCMFLFQFYGSANMPNIQRLIHNRRLLQFRQRNSFLDGEWSKMHKLRYIWLGFSFNLFSQVDWCKCRPIAAPVVGNHCLCLFLLMALFLLMSFFFLQILQILSWIEACLFVICMLF